MELIEFLLVEMEENKTYIEIEQINQETITQSKKTVDPLPEEIINFKPEEYLIGSGDVLSVSVWGPEELFPKYAA